MLISVSISEFTMYQACLFHANADRNLRAVVSKHLEQFGVTRMEWLLLAAASGRRGGLHMSALADLLNVSLPQVTALANKLLRAGLVEQRVEPRDRRSRSLVATRRGKDLNKKIEISMRNAMREWLADIPRPQLEIYMNTVMQLAADREI